MLNLLVAYPYWTDRIAALLREIPHRLIVDSGAWTAFNSGKEITLDGYCRFLDGLKGDFHAVQLDVFGQPEASWRNFLTMRERGYDVMPVFTRGDTLERLEEMYSLTDYVMFGGVVQGGGNKGYLKWIMERNRGRKIHWLGFTQIDFLKHYRPTSVDSSSWVPGRFGACAYYTGSGDLKTFRKSRDKPPREFFEACVRSGAEPWMPWAMAKNVAWTNSAKGGTETTPDNPKGMVSLLSAMAHLHRAKDIERVLGTRVYFAVPTYDLLELLIHAARLRGDV